MPRSLQILFAAALLALGAGTARAEEDAAVSAYGEGVSALQEAAAAAGPQKLSAWKRAEARFRKAVELKSDYAEAYGKLGQSLFNQGRAMEALTALKKAVAIDPRLTEAWVDMGFAFENMDSDRKLKGDEKTRKKIKKTSKAQAAEAYRNALDVRPVNDVYAVARAHYLLGALLHNQALASGSLGEVWNEMTKGPGLDVDGDKSAAYLAPASATASSAAATSALLKQAMLHLEEANRLQANVPAYRYQLGFLYYSIGKNTEAIAQYDAAIRGRDDFAEAYSNRGLAWMKAGNWQRALDDTRRATETDPACSLCHHNLGWILFNRVQDLRLHAAEGERYLAPNKEVPSRKDAFTRMAQTGAGSRVYPEAKKVVDEYRVAAELEPDNLWHLYGLAAAYRGFFDYENAAKIYEQILKRDKGQKLAKQAAKELAAEKKRFESHVPKQYR